MLEKYYLLFEHAHGDAQKQYDLWIRSIEPNAPAPNPPSSTLKVSLLIPCYKTQEKFLVELIESLLAQTYDNWEAIFVNDFSGSKSCLNLLQRCLPADDRFKLFSLDANKNFTNDK